MGVAILSREEGKENLVYSSCVQTSAELSFPERLKLLGDAVDEVVQKHKPELMALETLFYKATVLGLPVHQYTPLQVKVAVTGYGKADKAQVAVMVRSILKMEHEKMLDDELDAIAIGLTHFAHGGLKNLLERR